MRQRDGVNLPNVVFSTSLQHALSAGWFWQKEGLNSLADKGDLLAITKRINGGTSGFDGRKALYERALEVLQ